MSKDEIRRSARARFLELQPQRLESSRRACELLTVQPEYMQANNVMAFVGIDDEVDTSALRDHVLAAGKCLLLPRISWADRQLQPVPIACESQIDLRARVPQPVGGTEANIAEIDLVIVPGVAFDPDGQRVGRGQGFYDRFLARCHPRTVFCGFALEVQMVSAIPTCPWDKPVDLLVTEQAVRRFNRRPAN